MLQRVPKGSLGFLVVPLGSLGFLGAPWGSLGFFGVLWGSLEFLGVPTLEETFLPKHVFLANCVLIVIFFGSFGFLWVLLGPFGLYQWAPYSS